MKEKTKRIELIIPFSSLKDGFHHFEFEIDNKFFEQFEYSIIKDGEVEIKIEFEKRKTFFKLHFNIEGAIHSLCDRCSDELSIAINGEENLIVKFGKETIDHSEEIKIIAESDYELNLSNEIYEFVHLLLPKKIVHENLNNCNRDVLEKLQELSQKEKNTDFDPRWEKLNNLNRS